MLVTYAAPNRSHHYRYAAALARVDSLRSFVCGFSRFSPRAGLPEVGDRLLRADHLQNIYLASLKFRLPAAISDELAYLSKCWIDRCAEKSARESDLFLFYNGAGLRTSNRIRARGVRRVVEAVNSHVLFQQRLMREEHARLGLPFQPFHPREVARRVAEYKTADAILCPSHFVRNSFVTEGFPTERIFVVPYGITLPESAAPSRQDDGVFRVLYVGQISPRKGLRDLLEAFAGLRHPRKELVIVGPRSQPSGLENIPTPPNTTFTGVLKGEALALAYRTASVFVLPTIEEGLALVQGEALSYGLPVISTMNSGGEDLFQDGVEGFFVPIRSPESLHEKMQLLADDPALRQRMSAAALARAQALGGWDTCDRRLLEALHVMLQLAPR